MWTGSSTGKEGRSDLNVWGNMGVFQSTVTRFLRLFLNLLEERIYRPHVIKLLTNV